VITGCFFNGAQAIFSISDGVNGIGRFVFPSSILIRYSPVT